MEVTADRNLMYSNYYRIRISSLKQFINDHKLSGSAFLRAVPWVEYSKSCKESTVKFHIIVESVSDDFVMEDGLDTLVREVGLRLEDEVRMYWVFKNSKRFDLLPKESIFAQTGGNPVANATYDFLYGYEAEGVTEGDLSGKTFDSVKNLNVLVYTPARAEEMFTMGG